ncbi:VanZ family protein [Sporolactobacillus laevolacticus]|uniref:VanZ family protein n=1 Tax=Sporolactobacillus laevolacticus TaxID=33018 RepID=UPI0003F7ECA5|nr:VanZ family protein [Sporolactobacillus laevolacticus]
MRQFFFGLLVSVAIETLQFIEILFGTSIRVADIDDVICNGAGAALGYLIYKILIKLVRVFRVKLSHQSESASM